MPGVLGGTCLRGRAQIAPQVFRATTAGGRVVLFSFLCTSGEGVLGEAQSIALSIRDKRDSGVHLIYYFSNFSMYSQPSVIPVIAVVV